MPDLSSAYVFLAGLIAGAIGWLVNRLWDAVADRREDTDEHIEHQIGVLEQEKERLEEQIRRVSLEGREGRQEIQDELKRYATADTVEALRQRVQELRGEMREVRSLVGDVRVSQNKNFKAILDKLE